MCEFLYVVGSDYQYYMPCVLHGLQSVVYHELCYSHHVFKDIPRGCWRLAALIIQLDLDIESRLSLETNNLGFGLDSVTVAIFVATTV